MINYSVNDVFLILGAALLAYAALHDIVARTVDNRIAVAVAVCGLAAQFTHGTLLHALPAALAVFVTAAFCWRFGWMGGADVKLLAAAALLVPHGTVLPLIGATAIAGGLLALPYLAARTRIPRPARSRPEALLPRALRAEQWRLRRGGPLPYAVAIATGALFVLSQGGPS